MTAIVACQYCKAIVCNCGTIDAPATKAEFAEALANLSHTAKRCIRRTNLPGVPTPWDRIHEQIDINLTLWELAE